MRRLLRRSQSGQSVIELASILPVMILITIGVVSLLLYAEAVSEVDAATSLAAAAAAAAPASPLGSAALSATDPGALRTFNATIGQYSYFTSSSLVGCHGHTLGSSSAPTVITCTGHATIKVFNIPDWVSLPPITRTYTTIPSDYRVCTGNSGQC